MKKYIFILLALVLAVSCKDEAFLEEKTYNDDTGSFFTNQKSIEIALASAYSEIQYMVFGNQRGGSSHNWMVNGMGLDTFATTSVTMSSDNDGVFADWPTLTSISGYVRHYGEYMYKLSNRANIVVDMIDEHPEIEYSTSTMKDELRAEAVFLRAYAFRVIAGMFGNVVYNDHMTQEARYDYEMLSREEAWKLIAADFEYAEQTLPSTARMMGTVTKAAAAHYLAETQLALGNFAEAEAAASRVINGQDGDYHLMTTRFGNRADQATDRYGNSLAAPQGAYWDLFRTSVKTDGTIASEFVQRPAGDVLGSYWDDPNDFRGSEVMIQRDYYTPSGKKWSEVKKAVKARVDAGLYEITASDTVNITPRFWKFSDDKHIIQNDNCYYDTDWYMIRIAETYLLRAEARLAQGNKQGAADDINVLRNRAGAKPVSAGDVNIDYILDERVRELFGEEQRWITLSRLSCNPAATYVAECYPTQDNTTSNTLYERTRKYGWGYENDLTAGRRETYTDALGNTRHRPNIQPFNYVLPIPNQIIESNKDREIKQNYGYK